MKLTKRKLRKIIREEVQRLNENISQRDIRDAEANLDGSISFNAGYFEPEYLGYGAMKDTITIRTSFGTISIDGYDLEIESF